MLVIEADETARARGARILARLSGWGASCDASIPPRPMRKAAARRRPCDRPWNAAG